MLVSMFVSCYVFLFFRFFSWKSSSALSKKKLHNFTLIYPNHWLSNPGYGAILRLSSKDFFSVDLLKCTSFFFLEKWQNALRIGVLGVSNIYWSKINIPKYDLHFIKLKEISYFVESEFINAFVKLKGVYFYVT